MPRDRQEGWRNGRVEGWKLEVGRWKDGRVEEWNAEVSAGRMEGKPRDRQEGKVVRLSDNKIPPGSPHQQTTHSHKQIHCKPKTMVSIVINRKIIRGKENKES